LRLVRFMFFPQRGLLIQQSAMCLFITARVTCAETHPYCSGLWETTAGASGA